jgi:hypothetical protein
MRTKQLLKVMSDLDARGIWAVSMPQLRLYFRNETRGSFLSTISLHAKEGSVVRSLCRGVYYNPAARSMPRNTLVAAIPFVRPWGFHYVSLESVLGGTQYLSQLPGRLTVVSTMRPAVITTPLGDIEFVRTALRGAALMAGLHQDPETGVWHANAQRALQDYLRCRRARDLLLEVA